MRITVLPETNPRQSRGAVRQHNGAVTLLISDQQDAEVLPPGALLANMIRQSCL